MTLLEEALFLNATSSYPMRNYIENGGGGDRRVDFHKPKNAMIKHGAYDRDDRPIAIEGKLFLR